MKFRKIIILSVILLFCTAHGFAAEIIDDSYTMKLWTVEDRLPGTPLTGLTQSQRGYIWLSTETKLIRFNGVDFVALAVPDEVLEVTGSLRGVVCGVPRGVWFFGYKGIGCFTEGLWQSWPVGDSSTVIGKLLGILISGDGVVRAYAERGLLEAVTAEDDQTTRFVARACPVPYDDRATLGAVTAADFDNHGRLWMTAWNGLVEYSDGKYDDKSMRLPDFLVEAVSGVHAGRSGRLWINGPNGIAYLEKNIWTPIGFPENAGHVTEMFEVSDGALWIGNPTGIYRWENGKWSHIGEQDIPGGMAVNTIIEDTEGTIWAACDGGLLRIRKRSVGRVHSDGVVTDGTAYSFNRLSDGSIWIGFKGHAARLTADTARILQTIYLDADLPVSSILQDKSGQVWIGTLGGGLLKSSGDRLSIISQRDYSIPVVHTVYALLEDPDLGILAGTPQGLMRISSRGELETFELPDITIDETVRHLYRDASGTLWISCDNVGVIGLHKDGSKQLIGEKDGLKGYVRVVFSDSVGSLWIGTTTGLFVVINKCVYSMEDKIGGFNHSVLQIAEDRHKRIWLGTKNGLLSLSYSSIESLTNSELSDHTKGVCVLRLGAADGLPGERALGGGSLPGFSASTGKMFFPFDEGIAVFNPDDFKFSKKAPMVVIERVYANGKKLLDNINGVCSKTVFSPGVRNIVIQFSSLSPGEQSSAFFRYRVSGLRKEGWSPVQRERSASFEFLPPGQYLMEVVVGSRGVWSDESVKFAFEVEAWFWQRPWFYLAIAFVLAAVVFLFARWLMNHRYKLQMAILKREEALHHERARISRDIHDDLGNGLSVVATLSELAHGDVEKDSAHKRLDQIYDVANELARNVDEIVWAVNPVNDGWEPLISYFEQYTEYFLGNSSLRFHFVRPADLLDMKVASKTRHHLLLAVREAIGNILKHASATQVSIVMSIKNNTLKIIVKDDGVGFDPEVDAGIGHNGLKNMQRRMNEINGSFEIKSNAGEGSTLTFMAEL
jgi:signal transduction histidine kinase/ligand-binding sensor domain-containing protein